MSESLDGRVRGDRVQQGGQPASVDEKGDLGSYVRWRAVVDHAPSFSCDFSLVSAQVLYFRCKHLQLGGLVGTIARPKKLTSPPFALPSDHSNCRANRVARRLTVTILA